MVRNWQKILLIITLIVSLQGCVAFVGGAAIGATGAVAVYDRRNIKLMLDDGDISTKILQKLQANQEINSQCHIVVTAYRGTVLLVGQAPTEELRQKVEDVAKEVSGIERLYNQITIQGPTSNLTRASDSWVTTKVKTAFLTADNLKSGQFKVLTENGTVFLMGLLSRDQGEAAVDIARHVDGVQKVVKVFSYTRETSNIKPAPDEPEISKPIDPL